MKNDIIHYGKDKPYTGKEDNLQKACVQWLRLNYPSLLFFHPANGGYRSKAEAGIFKAMGVTPGVSDLFILRRSFPYCGLFVELKAKGGKLTEYQIAFINDARERQYQAVVVWSLDGFMQAVKDYLHCTIVQDELTMML